MAADYCHVNLRCTDSSANPYMTGFAVRKNNETGGSSLSQVADAVDTALTTAFRALMAVGETFVDIYVVDLGVTAPPSQFVKSKNLAGTRSTPDAKEGQGLCPVLSLQTNVASRSARGWMFLPNIISSDQVNAGFILTAGSLWTALGTFGSALVGLAGDSAGPGTVDPGVWSQRRFDQALSPYFFPLTATLRRQKVHWLRSRSPLAVA